MKSDKVMMKRVQQTYKEAKPISPIKGLPLLFFLKHVTASFLDENNKPVDFLSLPQDATPDFD